MLASIPSGQLESQFRPPGNPSRFRIGGNRSSGRQLLTLNVNGGGATFSHTFDLSTGTAVVAGLRSVDDGPQAQEAAGVWHVEGGGTTALGAFGVKR